MAVSIGKWRTEVEDIMRKEGVDDLSWTFTGTTHQRVSGHVTIKGGRQVRISLVVASSPSSLSRYNVRGDVRRAIRAARTLV